MKWQQMLQGNCHPLLNFCIEVAVVWKSLRKNKTTCYWGRTVPILVSSAIKKHHKKQDAEGRGHADTWIACRTRWSLPHPWWGRELPLQQPGKPSSGTVICVSTSLGTIAACAHSSSPAAAAQDFTDVPPWEGSCGSQPPSFHLPGGLAPPGCDGAAHSCFLPQPLFSQGLSSGSQRKWNYSMPFPRFPLVSWLCSCTLPFFSLVFLIPVP